MDQKRLHSIYDFLQAAEQLKNTLRSGYTSKGRQETTSDHTWRLCLMVMCFEKELSNIDMLKLLKLCIIHDLGEAISGDIPAIYQDPNVDKSLDERLDFIKLCAPLPNDLKSEMLELWDEYDQISSVEATFAKGFDKLETIMQHLIGDNPPEIDHEFNLTYGKSRTDANPLLLQIRELVDARTRQTLDRKRSGTKN